jgi:hypothetical protein
VGELSAFCAGGHRACRRKTGFGRHSDFHDWWLAGTIRRIAGITSRATRNARAARARIL